MQTAGDAVTSTLTLEPDTIMPWPDDRLHSDTFPYLLIFHSDPRVSDIHIVSVVPVPATPEASAVLVVDAAEYFAALTSRICCIVLNGSLCAWFKGDSGSFRSTEPPRGGFVVDPAFAFHPAIIDFARWMENELNEEGPRRSVPEDAPLPGKFSEAWEAPDPLYNISPDGMREIYRIGDEVEKEWHTSQIPGLTGTHKDLIELARPLAEFIGGISDIRVAGIDTLARLALADRDRWRECNGRLLDRLLRVLEPFLDLYQRAGIFANAQSALDNASTGMAMSMAFLHQGFALHFPALDVISSWRAHQDLVIPATVSSAFNMMRIDLFLRILERMDTGIWKVPPDVALPLRDEPAALVKAFKAAFKAGCGHIFVHDGTLYILPICRIMLDDDREPHCEDGPAMTDYMGNSRYLLHGRTVSERAILSPIDLTADEIFAEPEEQIRDVMIRRRAEARYAGLREGLQIHESVIIPALLQKGENSPC